MSVHKKATWTYKVKGESIQQREILTKEGRVKYHIIGDNCDKNIIPASRKILAKIYILHDNSNMVDSCIEISLNFVLVRYKCNGKRNKYKKFMQNDIVVISTE